MVVVGIFYVYIVQPNVTRDEYSNIRITEYWVRKHIVINQLWVSCIAVWLNFDVFVDVVVLVTKLVFDLFPNLLFAWMGFLAVGVDVRMRMRVREREKKNEYEYEREWWWFCNAQTTGCQHRWFHISNTQFASENLAKMSHCMDPFNHFNLSNL